MANPTYKITDMEALKKACPNAIQVVESINRPLLTRLWNAAMEAGMPIPGVEAVNPEDVLKDIPKHLKDAK